MEKTKITKVISSDHKLSIRELDGKITIFQAKYLFEWVDSDFKKFELDKSSQPTKRVNVSVSEIVSDETFFQIFTDINPDLEKNVLTMSQIITFCKDYPDWLSQGGLGTFFLTKKNPGIFKIILAQALKLFGKKMAENYFVVYVDVNSDGLYVRVSRLEYDNVWLGEYRHRVVAPQLIPLAV